MSSCVLIYLDMDPYVLIYLDDVNLVLILLKYTWTGPFYAV
jgi:hypothetical protein